MNQLIEPLLSNFHLISEERKSIISQLAANIQILKQQEKPIKLNYICTHNSRRSHFGQIAGALAAQFFNIKNVSTFSGGTEVTRVHQNTILALRNMGFTLESNNELEENPLFILPINEFISLPLWSKTYDDPHNPSSDFIAIMTCSSAETNCPFVRGANARISLTYEDPKQADGSGNELQIYTQTFKLILTEQLYAFSLLN